MLQNLSKSWLQRTLLVISVILSIILQYPQPGFDLSYYKSLASDHTKTKGDHPLEGVNIVITGATSGIGLSLTKVLHGLGGNIIAVGRSQSKLDNLLNEVNEHDGRIVQVLADFQDLHSVASAADEISSKFDSIDYLMNNAGVYSFSNGVAESTPQGYDLVFAVNYLSHFLFTDKLLPNLKRSKQPGGARIVQTASGMHVLVNGHDLIPTTSSANPAASQPSDSYIHGMKSYGNSKLAQIFHARRLTRELQSQDASNTNPVRVVSTCPTWVRTKIVATSMKAFLDLLGFSPDGQGMAPLLFAMFHPDAGTKGADKSIDLDYVVNNPMYMANGFGVLNLPDIVRLVVLNIGAGMMLGIQKFYASVRFTGSSGESYDVEKQDALYNWSQEAIKPWI